MPRLLETEYSRQHNIEIRPSFIEDKVIVGFDQHTAHGDTEQTWWAWVEGKPLVVREVSPTNPMSRFASPMPVSYDPLSMLHPEDDKLGHSKNSLMSIVHVRRALSMAGLLDHNQRYINSEVIDPDRVAVIMGTGYSSTGKIIDVNNVIRASGPGRVHSRMAISMYPEQPLARTIAALGLKGALPFTINAACASGGQAVATALDYLDKDYDLAIAIGLDAVLDDYPDLVMASFTASRATSQNNEDPTHASKPYDALRDGFMAATGIGVMIFARRSFAEKNGLSLYGKINKRRIWNDGNPEVTQGDPEGQAYALAKMLSTQRQGQALPEMLIPDVILDHATSTPLGDRTAVTAYHMLLGELLQRNNGEVPVALTAPKSVLAHTLGASGANAGVLAVQIIRDGIVPPVANLTNPQAYADVEINHPRFKPDPHVVTLFDGVNFVQKPIVLKNPIVLVNNSGFGSHNAAFVVEPV